MQNLSSFSLPLCNKTSKEVEDICLLYKETVETYAANGYTYGTIPLEDGLVKDIILQDYLSFWNSVTNKRKEFREQRKHNANKKSNGKS